MGQGAGGGDGQLVTSRVVAVGLAVVMAVALVGCGSSGGGGEASRTTRSLLVLRILVTNDDGYAAPGIDTVVRALRTLRRVDVAVVAPASNQSGQGAKTTPGPLPTSHVQTASGYPAVAVAGHPADTVRVALDSLGEKPDVVVSGINAGQNDGSFVDLSGTVGAARAAVARGIPALAVSAGLGNPPDFSAAVPYVLRWFRQHRDDLLSGAARGRHATVTNINVPTCTKGKVRGLVTVPVAPKSANPAAPQDCTSKVGHPKSDVAALSNGFASLTVLPRAG